jgi:hypothetical protein
LPSVSAATYPQQGQPNSDDNREEQDRCYSRGLLLTAAGTHRSAPRDLAPTMLACRHVISSQTEHRLGYDSIASRIRCLSHPTSTRSRPHWSMPSRRTTSSSIARIALLKRADQTRASRSGRRRPAVSLERSRRRGPRCDGNAVVFVDGAAGRRTLREGSRPRDQGVGSVANRQRFSPSGVEPRSASAVCGSDFCCHTWPQSRQEYTGSRPRSLVTGSRSISFEWQLGHSGRPSRARNGISAG